VTLQTFNVRSVTLLTFPEARTEDGAVALEPFYLPLDGPDGGRFKATQSTTGPWFADAQHVGPPTALLVRALERCPAEWESALTRVTVEVLGTVPAGEIEVRAEVERPGRSIALLGAEMVAAGRPVLRARAWRVAVGHTEEVATGAAEPLPPPSTARPAGQRAPGWLPGFIDAMEWRWVRGGFDASGSGTVWARPRVPIVDGEEPTALERLALVADSGNGAAAPLDLREWLFVNTELTIHLHRPPAGEWVAVDAETVVGAAGYGTVSGRLFDEAGHVGRSAQAIIVRPR
jgi:hypothetical protein